VVSHYSSMYMYRCIDLAELMVWHKKHRSEPGVMRLPVDSPAHEHVESTWPEFERDPRHVRLGLVCFVDDQSAFLACLHLQNMEFL
jgi:hypothetical protein